MLEELGKILEAAKMKVQLADKDLNELKALIFEVNQTKIKSMFPPNDAAEGICIATWPDRLRLDAIQLKERALTCQDIKGKVFDKIQCLTKDKSCQQERMADIKGMPRAMVKLQEYSAEKQAAGLSVTSST